MPNDETAIAQDAVGARQDNSQGMKERQMAAARGDSKSCTHDGCTGKMHFKREGEGDLRWVCDLNAQHK
jgi:hypothetical protein